MQIKFGLSQKEIKKAVKDVEKYKQDLSKKLLKLVQRLTDRGIEIAKLNVQRLGAVYSGELEQSIGGYFSPSLGAGIVYAGAWYAIFVEMGTGIRGKEAQHPKTGEIGWVYDSNNHGEEGWVYPKDGQFFWTDGMPARPFMYDMTKQLERECEKIAKAVFR